MFRLFRLSDKPKSSIELPEAKTALLSADTLSSVTIEIKPVPEPKTAFRPKKSWYRKTKPFIKNSDHDKERKDIQKCISILQKEINKTKIPPYFFRIAALLGLCTEVGHYISSWVIYNNAVDTVLHAEPAWIPNYELKRYDAGTCGDDHRYLRPVTVSTTNNCLEKANYLIDFCHQTYTHCQDLQSQTYEFCGNTLLDQCSNMAYIRSPYRYLMPTAMAATLALLLVFAYRWPKPKDIYLYNLSAEKLNFLQRIAKEHDAFLSGYEKINIDLIKHFEKILRGFRRECNKREAFVLADLSHPVPVSLLFNDPDLREPQLCNEIFEFADMKKVTGPRKRREAFLFGSLSKDAPVSLLFKAARPDQTRLCKEIFQFAELKP